MIISVNLKGHKYIFCDAKETCVKVFNSYMVENEDIPHFVFCLREQLRSKGFVYKRTNESWIKEIYAHNLLYRYNLFVPRTVDTDLNEEESKLRLLAYNILWYTRALHKFLP